MGEKLPDGECYREGIRYGHEWIWDLVRLVNAAAGTGMGSILPVGRSDRDRKSGGSEQRRRTIPVPVEMEPYG